MAKYTFYRTAKTYYTVEADSQQDALDILEDANDLADYEDWSAVTLDDIEAADFILINKAQD